jgi:hypothetical protein
VIELVTSLIKNAQSDEYHFSGFKTPLNDIPAPEQIFHPRKNKIHQTTKRENRKINNATMDIHKSTGKQTKEMTTLDKHNEKDEVSTSNRHPQCEQKVTNLGPYDILCGRHRTAFNCIGNRRFRVTINLNLPQYLEAKSKSQRANVITSVTNLLKEEAGARFLKPDNKAKGLFVELTSNQASSKVGHALRNMLVAQHNCTLKELEKGKGRRKGDRPTPDAKPAALRDQEEDASDLQESIETIMDFFDLDENDSFDPLPVAVPHTQKSS